MRLNETSQISDAFLCLNVSRNNLVGDSFTQLSLLNPFEYKKKLRIEFEGENGIDAGGLTKEWLLLFVSEFYYSRLGFLILISRHVLLR